MLGSFLPNNSEDIAHWLRERASAPSHWLGIYQPGPLSSDKPLAGTLLWPKWLQVGSPELQVLEHRAQPMSLTVKPLSLTSDISIFASCKSTIVSSRGGTVLSSATCSGLGNKPQCRLSPEFPWLVLRIQQSSGLPGSGFLGEQGSEVGVDEPGKTFSRLLVRRKSRQGPAWICVKKPVTKEFLMGRRRMGSDGGMTCMWGKYQLVANCVI